MIVLAKRLCDHFGTRIEEVLEEGNIENLLKIQGRKLMLISLLYVYVLFSKTEKCSCFDRSLSGEGRLKESYARFDEVRIPVIFGFSNLKKVRSSHIMPIYLLMALVTESNARYFL